MKRLRQVLLLFILWSIAFGVPITTSHAESAQTTKQHLTFEELGFRIDRQANGIMSELIYDFPIPRSWGTTPPIIKLHFSHSNLLLPDLSQMTILYNGLPLDDVPLTDKNQTDSWLTISVPETALKPGQNRLKIRFSQRLNRDACSDNAAAPGLWSTIHKDSTITFEQEAGAELDLAWFPEPFSLYGRKAVQPVKLTFVLPATPDESELEAAGLAAAKLGQLAGVRSLDLSVSLGKMPRDGQAFVIARTERAEALLAQEESDFALPLSTNGFRQANSRLVSADDGVLQIAERSDGSALLLLSGESDSALSRAAEALADSNSLNLMSGPFTLVKEAPQQAYASDTFLESTTLEELTGMGTRRAEGHGASDLAYCFQIPQNWDIGPDAMLNLNYSHSATLWEERSSLAVRLNGTTLSTVKLDTQEGGAQKQLAIPLPANKLVAGNNCLLFGFTLRLEQNSCSIEFGGEGWGEIDGKSLIDLPHTVTSESDWLPSLAHYPYPFSLDEDLGDITLVLSDSPSEMEIEGALEVAAKLGHEARHPTLQLQMKSAQSWDSATDSENHLVLIGNAERNIAIAQLEESLKLDTSNETTMQIRQELLLHQETGAAIASAELLTSPWDSERGILHLSGHDGAALAGLFEVLSSNRTEERFNGNIISVTEMGLVRSVDTINRSVLVAEMIVNSQGVLALEKETSSTIRWFLWAGLLMLGLILLTTLLIVLRGRTQQPQLLT